MFNDRAISMNQIAEDIRNGVDIVDVVSRYVVLKKSGANFVGLSPFRQEKTPSFVVSPHKQIFKDFGGDGLGGDVITFIMEIENIDFMDAVRMLAKDAGVDLSQYDNIRIDKKHEEKKETIKRLGKVVQTFFHQQLLDSEKALNYLYDKRQLSDAIIEKFQLGYAPNSYYDTLQFLQKQGFEQDEILQASLSKKGHGGDSFSFFRDRLMIPIFDKMGNTIGFGARALDEDTKPKYINTTDTLVYDKSKVLYGINFVKEGVRENAFLVVVEGYMDVIAWSRMGYDNAVATCGTALTSHHLKSLKRYSNNLYLLFDMDNAGFEATQRALKLAYTHDVYPKVIKLPNNHKDIDDMVNDVSLSDASYDEIVGKLFADSKDAMNFVIEKLEDDYDFSSPIDKKRFLDDVFGLIAYINSPTIQHGYLELLADRVSSDVNYVLSQFKSYKKNNHRLLSSRRVLDSVPDKAYHMESEKLLAALCRQGYLTERVVTHEKQEALLLFLSELVDLLPDDDIVKKSWYASVDHDAVKNELDALQLRRDKELEDIEVQKQFGFILQKIHTPINILISRLQKLQKISREDLSRLLALRKDFLTF